MKSIHIIYSISLALLILTFNAFCAVDVAELVKNHPVQADFPNDETVILYEGIDYTLENDGRIIKTVHRIRTLFNENSMDNYGDISVDYYEAGQDLNVEICRAYMLDGKAVDTWENGFNQITPPALDKAPDYTGFQEMVITHTGLEWGGTTELKYSIIDRKKISEWMEGIEYFQTDEYIMHKQVSVTVPETVDLHFRFLNGDGNVKQKVSDGKMTWTWEINNMPHILHDDAYRYRLRFAPALIFSTCHDWKYARDYYAKNIKDLMGYYESIKTAADTAAQESVEEMDIVNTLSEYVRDNVRTVNYSSDDFSWFQRSSETTLKSRYGSTFNKAILLGALLRAKDFKSYVAVSSDIIDEVLDVPMTSIFDNFWVVVQVNGENLFIDPEVPFSKHSYKDLAGNIIFVLDFEDNTPEISDVFPLESNNVVFNMNIKIKDDGSYSGNGYFEAGGFFNPYYEILASNTDKWIGDHFDGILPNLKLENVNARKLSQCCVELNFDFKGENLGEVEEGFLKIDIPESPIGISSLFPSGFNNYYTKHKNPVYLRGIGSLRLNLTFDLPDNWSTVYMPSGLEVESENILISSQSEILKSKLRLNSQYSILNSVFESGDYQDLHRLYSLKENAKSYIVFRIESL